MNEKKKTAVGMWFDKDFGFLKMAPFSWKSAVSFLFEALCNCYISLLIFIDEEGQVSAV